MEGQPQSKKKKYRKDKPWDNDPTVDKWKMPELGEDFEAQPFLEESSFATLFPAYREKYIRDCFSSLKKSLAEYGIKVELDLSEGSLTVKTTDKTKDPYAIIKARDVIKLIARSVPYTHALRIMEDDVYCDIIKIRSYVRNTQRFVKRRQRLIGPEGGTLKALELLTGCYILVQGSTVCMIGEFKQIKQLRRIVIDAMRNIHPIYHIKELMIKRELAKDPALANQNWDRFLPQFKAQHQKRKASQSRPKKEYDPFPPEQQPRKEDIQMETGEYFLTSKEKEEKNKEAVKQRREERMEAKQKQKEREFQPEEEERKREVGRSGPKEPTLEELKAKFMVGSKKVKLFQD